MTTQTSDVNVPPHSAPGATPAQPRRARLRASVERLRRGLRERWEWYRQQQAEDRERHWWDVYNR